MTAKQSFTTALGLVMASTNCSALSKKIGRPESFISNLARNVRAGNAINKKSLDSLFRAFPMLRALVENGTVDGPKMRSTPANNHSPEHMAKMHAARREKAAARRARKQTAAADPTALGQLIAQLTELQDRFRALFPQKP